MNEKAVEDATIVKITDARTELTQDGLENLIAQLGTDKDKRSFSRFVNSKRLSADGGEVELNALYRTDWGAGKIVDIIPDDMTREWRQFTGDIDPKMVKQLTDEEDRLELVEHFNQAHKWGRLYGTAFIVMSIDDGNPPEMPLEIDKIKLGGLRHIKAIDRHRISNAEVVPVQDPLNKNFGIPEWYRFNETSVKIHHSRVLRFDGIKLPFDEFRRNNYYSDSVLDRLYDVLTNFNTVQNSAASMVYETNVDVIKLKGLMNHLQTPEGEALLRKRFSLAKLLKSFNNMMLLDSQEEFETKTNSFAGLDGLIDRYALFLAGASDIPATRFLGSSASGLNATGEGDLKNYYDTIKSAQKKNYKPKLDYFDQIMAKSMGLSDDTDLSYIFNSLFQMTPKEEADLQLAIAGRDDIYLNQGVVTELIVAKELKQSDTYTNITDEDIDDLEEFQNELITFGSTDPESSNSNNTNSLREGAESAVDPNFSLNGAQVTAILEIIGKVREGFMLKETAIKVLMTSFPLSEEEADNMLSAVPENVDAPKLTEGELKDVIASLSSTDPKSSHSKTKAKDETSTPGKSTENPGSSLQETIRKLGKTT